MSQTRQLAAIMFTDIVGYTALMGNDEQKAFQILIKNRELQKPIIEKFGGRWIKELGDGVMASFTTVSDAVYAAIEIQQAANLTKEFLLRIGIHHGEVVFDGDDVFGDAVNVASRIQAIAPVGGIWISESVHLNVVNKKDIQTEFVKAEKLKNVKEPVKVFKVITETFKNSSSPNKQYHAFTNAINNRRRFLFAGFFLLLVLAGYFIYTALLRNTADTNNTTTIKKSIAVLPFVNMSSDQENEYFSDGITEEITTQLSKITDLKVIARTSAMAYKGSEKPVKEIAGVLHVATILKGSVQKTGNRIKITAQLIDANTEEHIWAEKYEKDLNDIFSIQNQVANHIAAALHTNLFNKAKKQPMKKETENVEAYNLYLKGRYYLNKGKEDDLHKALDYFEQAIQKDIRYAKGYAGQADAYLMLGEFEFLTGIEAWPKAEAAIKKALALDETSADAHNSFGHLSFHLYNWSTAERELKRAIELSPTHAEAHHFMAQYLSAMGRMDESIREILVARELDPLSLLVNSTLGNQLHRTGRNDEAMEVLKKTLELQPDYWRAHRNLARVYMSKGMFREAIAEFEKSLSAAKDNPNILGFLGNAYGRLGERDKALQVLNKLKMISNKKELSGEIALVYIGLGEMDLAFQSLDKAIKELSVVMLQIKSDPEFDVIRTDRRYNLVLKKMGLE